MKKIIAALMFLGLGSVMLGCKTKTTTTTTQKPTTQTTTQKPTTQKPTTQTTTQKPTTKGDTQAPVFTGLIKGELQPIEHLKGEEVELYGNISVIDDVDASKDVTVTITDMAGYDKNIPGVYKLEYTATDKSGNSSTVKRTVTVHETVVKAYKALMINDVAIPYFGEGETTTNNDGLEYTMDKAFLYGNNGIYAATLDKVSLMSYETFKTAFKAGQDSGKFTDNGNDPYMSYGGLVALDANYTPVYVRLSKGTALEILPDNTLVNGADASFPANNKDANGGGLLGNLDEVLAGLVEAGTDVSYVGIVANPTGTPDDVAIRMFVQAVYYPEYASGAIYASNRVIMNQNELVGEINDDYQIVVAKPDALEVPTFTIIKNTIHFTGVDGAKFYEIYVDGVLQDFTISHQGVVEHAVLLKGETALNLEDGTYELQIRVVTKDILQWSDSELSEVVEYTQFEVEAIDAPAITLSGDTISWEAVANASKYAVYVNCTGIITNALVGETTETSYDLSAVKEAYANFVNVYVVALGDDTHYDSAASNVVFYDYANVKPLVINGYQYTVLSTTYADYFSRRNTTYAQTGYAGAPYVFHITDFDQYKYNTDAALAKKVVEAYSVVVLLDKDNNVKYVSNIMTNFKYVNGAWQQIYVEAKDSVANTNNLAEITGLLSEGDSLLVFKNGNTVDVVSEDGKSTLKVNARHIGAYHFVSACESYDGMNTSATWKTLEASQLVDMSKVEVSLPEKFIEKLAKPVLTLNKETGVITWETVDGADLYVLFVNGEAIELATTVNSFDINSKVENWAENGFTAQLQVSNDNRYQTNISDKLEVYASQLVITPKAETIVLNIADYLDVNNADAVPTEHDFLKDVTVTENGEVIDTVEVINDSAFKVKKVGIYVVTFRATGANGTKDLDVTYVVEYKTVWYVSMTVGDNTTSKTQAYCHQSHNIFAQPAWVLGQDRLHTYTHLYYQANKNETALLNSGVVLVYNHKMELQAFRCSTGTAGSEVKFEVLKDGSVKTTDLSWDITTKNGLFTGVDEILASLPNGGYVCYAPTGAIRTFMFHNLLGATEYAGGIFDPALIKTNPYTIVPTLNLSIF
jgi:hypothetical protein